MKKILKITDEIYPKYLKEINNPPEQLFCLGNVNLLNYRMIAVIGSRECTTYGKQVTFGITKELVINNYVIISGLSKGISKYAHIGGLTKTMAILASGFNNIYPIENIPLVKAILRNNGLIITPYDVDEKACLKYFIERNRILAALASDIIIVETTKNYSETFLTVDYALEMGKNIYAVPGNINSPYSEGTNQLLKEGAKPYTSSKDLE